MLLEKKKKKYILEQDFTIRDQFIFAFIWCWGLRLRSKRYFQVTAVNIKRLPINVIN